MRKDKNSQSATLFSSCVQLLPDPAKLRIRNTRVRNDLVPMETGNTQIVVPSRGFTGVYSAFGPWPPPCANWCNFSQKWRKFPSKKCKFKKRMVPLNSSTNVQSS